MTEAVRRERYQLTVFAEDGKQETTYHWTKPFVNNGGIGYSILDRKTGNRQNTGKIPKQPLRRVN